MHVIVFVFYTEIQCNIVKEKEKQKYLLFSF